MIFRPGKVPARGEDTILTLIKGGAMFKRLDKILGGCLCSLLLSCSLAGAYDYPFADPYVATVVGTPS